MAKMNKFEGSKKDMAQDAKLAKKYKMSPKEYEKSSVDAKHDKQKSMAGLNHGGSMYASGGKVAKRDTPPSGGENYSGMGKPRPMGKPTSLRKDIKYGMKQASKRAKQDYKADKKAGKDPEGMRERMRGMMGGKGPEGMRGLTGVGQKPKQAAPALQAQQWAPGRTFGKGLTDAETGRQVEPLHPSNKTATTAPTTATKTATTAPTATAKTATTAPTTATKTATTAPPTATKTATGVKKGGSIKKLALGGPMGGGMMQAPAAKRPIDPPSSSGMMQATAAKRPITPPSSSGMMQAPAAVSDPQATIAKLPQRMAKGGSVNGVAKKGKTSTKMVKMASGGSFRSSANGIASRGKTKGRMC